MNEILRGKTAHGQRGDVDRFHVIPDASEVHVVLLDVLREKLDENLVVTRRPIGRQRLQETNHFVVRWRHLTRIVSQLQREFVFNDLVPPGKQNESKQGCTSRRV